MKHNDGKGTMYEGLCPTCVAILGERNTARARELGKARAKSLTPERRKEIAVQASEAAKTAREWRRFSHLKN